MVFSPTVPSDLVGSVAVVDLEAACEQYGCDTLPYPLGRSRPVGSVWLLTRDVGLIEDRLHSGDLRAIRAWVEAFVRADVCVECRVSYEGADTPDLRVHGVLTDERGFVAVQRADPDVVDVVDIYSVPREDLAAVVADSVGLVGSGAHARIGVADHEDLLPSLPEMDDEYDDFGFPIPQSGPRGPDVVAVDGADVVATGTVQARCDPAPVWGVDGEREVLQWVQVADDGDYLYAPDAGYAEPVDTEMLRAYIGELIADELGEPLRTSSADGELSFLDTL